LKENKSFEDLAKPTFYYSEIEKCKRNRKRKRNIEKEREIEK
jgi:hypothetical protein